ncbi:MAG: ribosomal protein L11 methyltransferase [Chlamydiales bacterium]|jgi:ribosomal protein L11 methyltransferase
MKFSCFLLNSSSISNEVWTILEDIGATNLYTITDHDQGTRLYCNLPPDVEREACIHLHAGITASEEVEFNSVDWEANWAIHAQNYRDGYVHLDLSDFGYTSSDGENKKILLKPGPGFGDLSHATTRITLSMMAKFIPGKKVLDIGSGSGVLSFASVRMGASEVVGIDIDEDAIIHAQENAALNKMNKSLSFLLPGQYHPSENQELVILMNMIRTEQKVAWDTLSGLHSIPGECFISGILEDERDIYLKECEKRNWALLEEFQEECWLGFRFRRNV